MGKVSGRTKSPARKEAEVRLQKAVGQRLRAVRDVLGLNQAEFGRRAKLAPNTYNMIELGERMPSILVAIAICDAHRLTLDFIFRGDTGDLPHGMGRAIDAMLDARSEHLSSSS
jgi:DNA-binding XRE family transcriptional regulator